MMLALAVGLLLAQDASPHICFTTDELAAATNQAADEAPDKHIRIAATAQVDGETVDTIVIVQGGQEVLAFLFGHGCLITTHGIDAAKVGVDDGKPKVGA